jgi:hypothetical protein
MENVFPVPAQQDRQTTPTIFDQAGPTATDLQTTAMESLTTATTSTLPQIREVDSLVTSPTVTTATAVTTPTTVLDLETSVPQTDLAVLEPALVDETTTADLAVEEPALLDDITTADLAVEEPAVAEEVTTGMVLAPLGDTPTSAPRTYEGDLPSTTPVEQSTAGPEE